MSGARVLCIGGLDPTGRAGLIADAWAVERAGGGPACVATALTVQGGRRFALNPVAPRVVAAQIAAARAAGPVHAVKLGMVAQSEQLRAILKALRGLNVPMVIDPVTRTSRGERLSTLTPGDYLALAKTGAWLTPNEEELAWLGDTPEALVARGFGAVLVKGGDRATDLFVHPRGERSFRSRPVRRDPKHHRGTGCRLASALATRLGAGDKPEPAIRRGRAVVLQFLSTPIISGRF